jgi:hypothetical protein
MTNHRLPPRCARCVHFEITGTRDRLGAADGECRDGVWPRLRSDKWCSAFHERRKAA